jgi:HD-GYP domain-containing protein (c-di-GMP phosphodiesterase class II)
MQLNESAFLINNEKYRRVKGQDIDIGEPLSHSVYSQNGDLLLKNGRIITTIRQKSILLNAGFILLSDLKKRNRVPHTQVPLLSTRKPVNEDVFDIKSRWLEELYLVFNLQHKVDASNFCSKILALALEIQIVTETQAENLLAAFQLDQENHYGLVHSLHCAVICESLALSIDMPRIERLGVIAGALTHDIGIVEIQDELHKQETALSDEQWQEVQQHPVIGHKKLIKMGVNDADWLAIALSHHERINGKGYPKGLKGEEVPLSVRIMSISDIYTALIRPTVFRPENTGKSALTVLYKERGESLDAKLVDVLIQRMGVFPLGTLVKLVNDETAVVIKRGSNTTKPHVASILDHSKQLYKTPIKRDTSDADYKIVGELSLEKHRLIHSNIEKLFSHALN